MCRITGIWSLYPSQDLEAACTRMRDTLTKGGPDDAGLFIERHACIALGHRRLSIIDLTATGHQPMSTPDGRYTISYNGEVYNYRELRKDLESQGLQFRSTSDTEVVLNAFALWGPECVEKFIGMFAFAIWDTQEKELYLFRDRMGVKPLFYYEKTGTFAFASELKALHTGLGDSLEIDEASLDEFFHYGYICAPRSICKHTYKVEPDHKIKNSQLTKINQSITITSITHYRRRNHESYYKRTSHHSTRNSGKIRDYPCC